MSDSQEEFQGAEEEIVPEDEAQNPALVVKKLREKLAAAEKERGEYLEGWQRSRAEFSNLKRDEDVRRAQTAERLKASFAEELIPALDSFEMALNAPSFKTGSTEWQKGFTSLYQQFVRALKNAGVEQIGGIDNGASIVGQPFDPKKHEILREVPIDDAGKEHTIEQVFASGYSVGEHTIRPAQVSVWVHKK